MPTTTAPPPDLRKPWSPPPADRPTQLELALEGGRMNGAAPERQGVRLSIYIDEATVRAIDNKRGSATRGAHLRAVLRWLYRDYE